jgi:ElaB/YqjD/DUF883 family membrane-anchored ribosome-binding protein
MDSNTPAAADQSVRNRFVYSLKNMVNEAEHLLNNAQRSGSDEFNAARAKFEAHLKHAKAELTELEDEAIHQAKRAARAADHAVHAHPYAAMGIAAGAGLLIGMLVSRR